MKKCLAALTALCASLFVLSPCAQAITTGQLEILGADRIAAYWVLGISSVLFTALVVIWSIRLKRTAKKHPAHVVYRMQK